MYTLPLDSVVDTKIALIGGKAHALASLSAAGERIPKSLCITTKAYDAFLDQCNLREKIALELNRKNFHEMRWEEMWDTALRIRRLFINTPMPDAMASSIGNHTLAVFEEKPVAIRSSSPDEDTAKASFAGLHESFINISGKDAIIDHIKKVWASLWSDAALLYRQEIDLAPHKSSIAVLIQEVIDSDVSGVMFSRSPDNEAIAVIEAIYGLNQGLVDGTIEPDRWLVRITDSSIVSHHQADRERRVIPVDQGTTFAPLTVKQQHQAPLTSEQVKQLTERALQLEKHFNAPQDIEWTFVDQLLYLLQSRPITTGKSHDKDDKRPWHLSLRRSFASLITLHKRIGDVLLPAMDAEAGQLAALEIQHLKDKELADEIRRRIIIHTKWVDVYWSDFIPFAHGMRLFGQVYNDRVKPDDPYEFVSLLSSGSLASINRNRLLLKLGAIAKSSADIRSLLAENRPYDIADREFANSFNMLQDMFGEIHLSLGDHQHASGPAGLVCSLILKLADKEPVGETQPTDEQRQKLEKKYFDSFPDPQEQEWAEELLKLGRASYTFRDDDNIYLGRIEQQLNRVLDEARSRLQARQKEELPALDNETIIASLEDHTFVPQKQAELDDSSTVEVSQEYRTTRARQLIGQPAGPGIAIGVARVVTEPGHLQSVQQGEILICDSIDPNMTFIVPLVAGIVERRGGMLIHGAIIAREYGIACVTGIPDATNLIHTGDPVTVDGYLGIVTIRHVQDPLA